MRKIASYAALAFVTLTIASPYLHAQDRFYGRSVVSSPYGIVATSYVQASQAGARILEQGGSAIDAAIAANAVLSVEEPMMNGIGGDLFAIYWDAKTGKLYGLNASGWSPKALTIDHLNAKGITTMPTEGIDSITVPGAVDGWTKLHDRFGKLPWHDLFQPAIFYAEHGVPVPEMIHDYWLQYSDGMLKEPETRRVFMPGDKEPATGQVFRNPDLAHALTLLADGGEDVFYKGAIAKAILKTSTDHGGTMTAEDLATFTSEWVEPISTRYRDWTIYELPPNVDGMAALEMLNIMGQFKPSPDGPNSPTELHTRIEAMKLAYADVKAYDADPKFGPVPVKELLSPQYAAKRAALIDPAKANCTVAPGALHASDTTYLSVVDREGNILSFIQSNSSGFGSKVTVDGMGFLLHNRGIYFTLDRTSPNALAGRKRPFHTIMPGFMERGNLPSANSPSQVADANQHIGFGIMGGLNQPLAHAQFVSNVVDYHMNIQAAMEAPRFTVNTKLGCNIVIESRIPPASLDQLTKEGHILEVRKEYSDTMGRGQAVLHDSTTKINYAASDPRADGSAEPEAPPAMPQPPK